MPDDGTSFEMLLRNVRALLGRVGQLGTCRGCKAEVYWVRHRDGAVACYEADGSNHLQECPYADRYRRKEGGGDRKEADRRP